MPALAPYVCQCGKAVPGGTRCACRAKQDRERKARHDAIRPTARQRGYSSKWETERADFLKVNRTCAMCPKPSALVDHKTPHRGDRRLFWSRSNWQPLCTTCHSSRKQREERR